MGFLPNQAEVIKLREERKGLIALEEEQRSDYAFKQSLSPVAKKACEIVRKIRKHELKTIWNEEDLYPGMMFNKAKEPMTSTKLWEILKQMPKGSVLHAHHAATVPVEWVLEKVLESPDMYFTAAGPLDSEARRRETGLKFVYLAQGPRCLKSSKTMWHPEYEAGSPVPIQRAGRSFPNGEIYGFASWIRGRCTVTDSESLDHHMGENDVWKKFQQGITLVNSMIHNEPIFRQFLQQLFKNLVEDKIYWIELRVAPIVGYQRKGEDEKAPYEAMMLVIKEEIEEFKKSELGKKFWGARVLWNSVRIFKTEQIVEDMRECIKIKRKWPELISGYDVVGQENLGRTLENLLPELTWFRKECNRLKLEIPFFFHAGECVGDGTGADLNLFDALTLGSRRIGHGFSLYKHPVLIEKYRERKIMIESCPISNEILRLCSSINSHPLPALLARGVAASLCNDDPVLLGHGTTGMTHDFWQALQGWENLGLAGLGLMAQNSVRWSAFIDEDEHTWMKGIEDGEKGDSPRAMRMRQWNNDWEEFCQWIVDNYGQYVEDDMQESVNGE